MVLVIVLCAITVLFYAFFTFDRLVKAEYENYRDEWVADGSPKGFFWRAPECTWLGSSFAMQRLSFAWLFKTPTWATQSAIYRGWLKQLRLSVLVWNVTVVGTFLWFLIFCV
jgi:hypothetical protein